MTDEQAAIALVQRTGRDALTVDQIVQLHHNGQLRPPPGVRVQVIGSLPGLLDECMVFHEAISHELVRRGEATYA